MTEMNWCEQEVGTGGVKGTCTFLVMQVGRHTEHQDHGVISSLVLYCDVLLQLFPILQSQQPPKIIKYLYK